MHIHVHTHGIVGKVARVGFASMTILTWLQLTRSGTTLRAVHLQSVFKILAFFSLAFLVRKSERLMTTWSFSCATSQQREWFLLPRWISSWPVSQTFSRNSRRILWQFLCTAIGLQTQGLIWVWLGADVGALHATLTSSFLFCKLSC